jgi:hypothetical protein
MTPTGSPSDWGFRYGNDLELQECLLLRRVLNQFLTNRDSAPHQAQMIGLAGFFQHRLQGDSGITLGRYLEIQAPGCLTCEILIKCDLCLGIFIHNDMPR